MTVLLSNGPGVCRRESRAAPSWPIWGPDAPSSGVSTAGCWECGYQQLSWSCSYQEAPSTLLSLLCDSAINTNYLILTTIRVGLVVLHAYRLQCPHWASAFNIPLSYRRRQSLFFFHGTSNVWWYWRVLNLSQIMFCKFCIFHVCRLILVPLNRLVTYKHTGNSCKYIVIKLFIILLLLLFVFCFFPTCWGT